VLDQRYELVVIGGAAWLALGLLSRATRDYALVDQGPGKHEADLRGLEPSDEELIAAARWSRTHDPSEGYRGMLNEALAHLGVTDAELGA
jgi:hypothetical protein